MDKLPLVPLPLEFSILDYKPEKWEAIDSLAIMSEFRYYLTVRIPLLIMPEYARKHIEDIHNGTARLLKECRDRCRIDARNRDMGSDPEYDHRAQHKQDALTEFRHLANCCEGRCCHDR